MRPYLHIQTDLIEWPATAASCLPKATRTFARWSVLASAGIGRAYDPVRGEDRIAPA